MSGTLVKQDSTAGFTLWILQKVSDQLLYKTISSRLSIKKAVKQEANAIKDFISNKDSNFN